MDRNRSYAITDAPRAVWVGTPRLSSPLDAWHVDPWTLAPCPQERDSAIKIQCSYRQHAAHKTVRQRQAVWDAICHLAIPLTPVAPPPLPPYPLTPFGSLGPQEEALRIAEEVEEARRIAEEALRIAQEEEEAALRIQTGYRGHRGRADAHLRRKVPPSLQQCCQKIKAGRGTRGP